MKNPLFFGRLCMCGHHEIDFLFSFFFRKRKREQLDERDPLLCCAVCLYIFLDIFFIFFCSSAWTWTLCVCDCTNTHTHTESLFHPLLLFILIFFCVLMAGDKSYANLWLIPFVPFFLPSTISLNNFYLSLIHGKKKKKLISPLPPQEFL